MTEEKEPQDKKNSFLKGLLEWGIYIVVLVGLCYVIITFVGQRTEVFGQSMEPNLEEGDNLIVDKISYRFREPKRYEIIVFPYKYQENVHYIKRIIGLPGDTIQVKDGYVYINGELLESEHYGKEVMDDAGIAAEPLKLGEDEYFVLGDNRNNSLDSRSTNVGILKKTDLTGRAWIRIFPFNKIGKIDHE